VIAPTTARQPSTQPAFRSGPRAGSTIAVVVATAVSLAPSLLPRSAPVQAAVTGMLIAAALGVAALVRRSATSRLSSDSAELRWLAAAVGAATVAVSATVAHRWQNDLRTAMSLPPIGFGHWVEVAAGAVAIATVVVAVTAAARWGLDGLHGHRVATVAVAVTVTVACASVPALTFPAGASGADTDGRLLSSGVSGSTHSFIQSNELGREGLRFVTLPSPGTPVRVYVPLVAAPDARSRADVAVRELDRAGGFDRGHLVIAVPTGSGWVDANAVHGFEDRWGDDVAIVAQQYADTPSWVTFVFDRGTAGESARALTDAVRAHVLTLPPQARPRVHVYGQSLGALGGSSVDGGSSTESVTPGRCGLILVGPPAGTPVTASTTTTVVANTSDPVVWWQPSLLWVPPDLSAARPDAPVPTWIPVVSFLQTTVDLVTSLDSAPGHGHRYGAEQARCDPGPT